MSDKTKSLLKKWGVGGLLIVVIIPIAVNLLMLPQAGATGQPDTWITFFGSYVGSILSGLLTLIGVLLTINCTVEQNKINQQHADDANLKQLEFTREENQKMLEESQKESRRNKLPEMIYNLEECLDYIENQIDNLYSLRGENTGEINVAIHFRKLKLLAINEDYSIIKQQVAIKFTKDHPRAMRNLAVKSGTPVYEEFVLFQAALATAYFEYTGDIKSKFNEFRGSFMFDYFNEYDHIILKNGSNWKEIPLVKTDADKLILLKRELYEKDRLYLRELINVYENFQQKLRYELLDLTRDFNC